MTKRNHINARRVLRMCVNGGGKCSFGYAVQIDKIRESIALVNIRTPQTKDTAPNSERGKKRNTRMMTEKKTWQKLGKLQRLQRRRWNEQNKPCSRISIVTCVLHLLNSFAETPMNSADWNFLFLWNVFDFHRICSSNNKNYTHDTNGT